MDQLIQGAIFAIASLGGALLWIKIRPAPPKPKEIEIMEKILERLEAIDRDMNLSALAEIRDDMHLAVGWLERIYEEK